MYSREKPLRDENHKPKKGHKHKPSFSSTLLDEIYRSIDGNVEEPEDFYRERPQGGSRVRSRSNNMGDEGMARFTRACLVEKWMEKEKNETRRRPSLLPELENSSFQDNDLLFFSSTPSSSDSSGALSSSDTEFFGSSRTKSKVSCFSTWPKPVRTGVKNQKQEFFMLDHDHRNNQKNDDLIKSKSRALKIYANLKKMKQPISPGGRLTSFINSLFNNGGANGKKSSKVVDTNNKGFQDWKSPKTASISTSTCSSASSFSRSCLSKHSWPKSMGEKMRDGIQRTVRFHPVGVVVDEDSKPCGHKSIYVGDIDKYGRPPLPPNEMLKNMSKGDFSLLRKIYNDDDGGHDDDDDSDSSSDLFELDHLVLFRNNSRFCEDLSVYETTYFD